MSPPMKAHPDCPVCQRNRARYSTPKGKRYIATWLKTPKGIAYLERCNERRRKKYHQAKEAAK